MAFSKKVHRAANAPFPECITVRVDSYFNDRVAARACGAKRLMHAVAKPGCVALVEQ